MTQVSSARSRDLALPLTGGNWPAFKPYKAPNVGSRHKDCTSCGAQPGESCVNAKGDPVDSPHRARRVAAIRERNNA